MQHFYVYMLKCRDESFYIGHTDDIEKRLSQHQMGQASLYTAQRLPIEIVFVETCGSRDEAFTLEKQLKGWSRKKKQALINRDWHTISILAKSKSKNS